MRRGCIKAAYGTGIALGAVLGLGVLLFLFANTRAGMDTIARLVPSLTGGKVAVGGLSGSFPSALRAAQVEIRDDDSAWLVLDDVVIEWSPLALLDNHVDIARLSAQRAQVLRLPVDNSSEDSKLRIDIGTLDVPRLDTAAALSRTPMEFAAQGGGVHYASLRDLAANVVLTRRGGPDSYRFNGTIKNGVANGVANIDESPNGLITGLLGLNDIGPIRLTARASGAPGANRIVVMLDAGQLHASGGGTIDLSATRADVDFSADAPAMAIRPDLSWDSLSATGKIRGTLAEIGIDAKLDVARLRSGGNSVDRLTADVRGANGTADLSGTAMGLRLSGTDADTFARDPIALTGHADFGNPLMPVSFTLSHPLLSADGTINLGGQKRATLAVSLPRLESFAALGGPEIAGSGKFNANLAFTAAGSHLVLNGTLNTTGGDSIEARLLSHSATLALEADVAGSNITIGQARVDSDGMNARLTGNMRNNVLALDLALTLPELSRVTPTLKGDARIVASARGPMQSAKLQATATGNVASEGFAQQRVTLTVNATGFPKPSMGAFRAGGDFNDAPVTLDGSFGWNENILNVSVTRGDWKSLHARADLTLPENAPARGQASLRMDDLQDLVPIFGRALAGQLDATIDFQNQDGASRARVNATAQNLRVEGVRIGTLTAMGDVIDPAGKLALALDLHAANFAVVGFNGEATAHLNGPMNGLGMKLDAKMSDADGNPATISSAATLDSGANLVKVTALDATYRDQRATLQGATTVSFGAEVTAENFTANIGEGRLSFGGRLAPTLQATASLQNVDASVLRPFAPVSQGTLSATAELTGTLDAPAGMVNVQGRDLKLTGVPAGVAPASLQARANLHGRGITIEASLNAGMSTLVTVTGEAPLALDQPLKLYTEGNADLAILNPILSVEGRKLSGQFAFNANVSGTMNNPKIAGAARLTNGEVQDTARGVRVREISFNGRFENNSLQIVQLTGKAGPGTITGSGSVNFSAPGMPIDLTFEAQNARPITSDRFRANVDAKITLKGLATERLAVAGTITIRNGESILPESFPPRVVSLTIRRPGQSAPAPETARRNAGLNLDLTIRSPGQFFVRGRGIDAELQGEIRIAGTDSNPVVAGGLTMRHGTLDLAGQSIVFTSGKVTFDGIGLRNQIDPTLDFEAETSSGGVTAKIAVTGYASAPRIQLSSTPPLPQDEILARLLFHQSVKELSPFQLAGIAQAAASLGGLGSGFNPLASVRRSLGLDRLSVGSATNANGTGTQTTIEAGKYIAPNVYVGAKQGLSNTTQAEVQVDLTDNLKAKATVNAGTNATVTQGSAQQELGSSVGLSYQFEY